METVHVVAIVTARPGKRAELLQAFQANVPNVHAEDGCIEYVATVDAEGAGSSQTRFGEDSFVVVEKWASLAALEAHAAAPHMAAYAARTKDLIASRSIHVLSPV
jgi:quinol monooxygenase YgiN